LLTQTSRDIDNCPDDRETCNRLFPNPRFIKSAKLRTLPVSTFTENAEEYGTLAERNRVDVLVSDCLLSTAGDPQDLDLLPLFNWVPEGISADLGSSLGPGDSLSFTEVRMCVYRSSVLTFSLVSDMTISSLFRHAGRFGRGTRPSTEGPWMSQCHSSTTRA
jgi:hypothetical protein